MTSPGFTPVPLTVQAVTPPAAYAGDCAGASAAARCSASARPPAPALRLHLAPRPADAVYVAVRRFAATYWTSGPDVVLSGVNFGQNVGATLNHSGTVGAAVTASENGVAAIALSAEVPFSLARHPEGAVRADLGVRRHAAQAAGRRGAAEAVAAAQRQLPLRREQPSSSASR